MRGLAEHEATQRTIRGRRGSKPPWAESWSAVNAGLEQATAAAQQQQQFEAIEEENASSRASSPSKSPLMQAPAFLDQADAPLSRQPALAGTVGSGRHRSRAAAAAAAQHQQQQQQQQQQQPFQLRQQIRPLELPGGSQPRPTSPPLSQSQYNRLFAAGGSAAGEGAGPSAAAAGGAASGTPGGGRRMLFERGPGGGGGGFGAAAPSDPMTYFSTLDKDGVPNMGDVPVEEAPLQDWRIGAQRTGGAPPARYSPMPSQGTTPGGGGKRGLADKPGAAVKMGRRQAWLKFLAYEARRGWHGDAGRGARRVALPSLRVQPCPAPRLCSRLLAANSPAAPACWPLSPHYPQGSFQLCLEQVLGGAASERASAFLHEGCRELKGALGFEALLLPPLGGGPGGMFAAGAAETAIYWDDKEEGAVTAVECIEAVAVAPPPPPLPPAALKQHLSLQQPPPPAPKLARASGSSLASGLSRRAGPFIEARPARVVGCALLGEGRELFIAMYPSASRSGGVDDESFTHVHSDGSMHEVQPLLLDLDGGLNDTVTVELVDRRKGPLAQGTVQVAELHRLANQPDAMFDDGSSAPGFLRAVFPCLRKGARTNSMAWVKLVDDAGVTAGHAVLQSRMVAGMAGAGAAAAPSEGFLRPASMSSVPLIEELETMSVSQPEPVALAPPPPAPPPPAMATQMVVRVEGMVKQGATSAGFLHVTAVQVYDELLTSALRARGCGPGRLKLEGDWRWLLDEFAAAYGVRDYYCRLSFLRWVVRPENATVTFDCFSLLLEELGPLKAAQAASALSSGELGVLAQVCARVEELLRTTFENYFMLRRAGGGGETAESGMMDGALAVRSGIPAVLSPAVGLFALLRDPEGAGDQAWLLQAFTTAARKRYQGLLSAVELHRGAGEGRGARGGAPPDGRGAGYEDAPEAVAAYGRMKELVKAVVGELRCDAAIQRSGVLPPFVRLPEVTALSYVKDLIRHLGKVLAKYPPPAPSEPAVQLVEAVGRLQDHVMSHGYTAAAARISSRDIFSPFVLAWIGNSREGLHTTCRALEAGAPAAAAWKDMGMEGKQRVAPLVEEMLSATEHEMGRYARIIQYWPTYGQDLEKCVTGALRDTTLAVSRQCGLVQVKEGAAPSPDAGAGALQPYSAQQRGSRASPAGRGRAAWRWVQPHERAAAPAAFRGGNGAPAAGISPLQALLLNSLRRLLAASPQLEHLLLQWCSGPAAAQQSTATLGGAPSEAGSERIARDVPNLGAQFAQLVKELRSEYFAAITLCAERLSAELGRTPGLSVVLVLRTDGLLGSPQQITAKMTAVLEQLERLLQWLSATLDGRVFVALARGLWDLTAKDVLEYAEDLREGRGGEANAWRGRQNAHAGLALLDRFFKACLTASMGNDLQDKDLALPQHADRAHKLLADNMATVQMSYDVY
eukprot:scaffold20.g7719.t1